MEPILLPDTNRRWDCLSLGEVMLRLDPGEGRIHTTRQFAVWEGGGEYNVARGLRRCFGLRTAIATALADNAVGRLVEDLHPAGRRRHLPASLGSVRRRRPHRSQRTQLHRARIWHARRGRLQRSRPHGHQPGEAGRLRLGVDLRPEERLEWLHTGGIFAALSASTAEVAAEAMDAARRHGTPVSYDLNYRDSLWRSIGGKAEGAGSKSRTGAQSRPAARQRRRLLRHARR